MSSLLYPFKWPHPILHIVPQLLESLIDSPVPILLGYPTNIDFEIIKNNSNIIFYSINDDMIYNYDVKNFLIGKKLFSNKTLTIIRL